MDTSQYLQPAAAIAAELLRQWAAVNQNEQADESVIASTFEMALLGVLEGEKKAKANINMRRRSKP